MSALVVCKGIDCRLGGRPVLRGTDLTVAQRESVALLGSSGSGKSTLLRVIAGLELPERGEVLIGGTPATRDGRLLVPPHRRGIAMLFQDLALWPNLSVSGNVRLGLSGLRLPGHRTQERIDRALALCRISDLAGRRPGTLSGGQQQRVALARALAMHPKLLLLDEPLGGLDLLTKQAVLQEIARLKAELGFGVILVTHDPAEVRALCDCLAVLEDERIAEHGSIEAMTAMARSPLGKAFAEALQGTT